MKLSRLKAFLHASAIPALIDLPYSETGGFLVSLKSETLKEALGTADLIYASPVIGIRLVEYNPEVTAGEFISLKPLSGVPSAQVSDLDPRPAPDFFDRVFRVMRNITDNNRLRVFVVQGMGEFLSVRNDAHVRTQIAEFCNIKEGVEHKRLILIGPYGDVPPVLADCLYKMDYEFPTRTETLRCVREFSQYIEDDSTYSGDASKKEEVFQEMALALAGCTSFGSQTDLVVSCVMGQSVDENAIAHAKEMRKDRFRSLGISLETPQAGLVGGMDILKSWLSRRRKVFLDTPKNIQCPKGILLAGPPGCVAEGTIIGYKRGKRNSSRPIRIEDLYGKFNKIGSYACSEWLDTIDTEVQSWDAETGRIFYNTVKGVYSKGSKPCVKIGTSDCGEVVATLDHPVLLHDGTFKAAGELQLGDRLLVKGSMKASNSGKELFRKPRVVIEGLKYYEAGHIKEVREPSTGKVYSYQRQYKARLVMEAHMNKLPYEEFVQALKTDAEKSKTFKLLPRSFAVHHLDENPMNDELSNLKVLYKKEHDELHADVDHFNVEYTKESTVYFIEQVGEMQTYDISMEEPWTNFVVNDGIIVHNSGKTLVARSIAADWDVPCIALSMSDSKSSLFGESERRFKESLAVIDAVAPAIVFVD